MKFALVDNKRVEAFKGAKGICPCCGSELTAKCCTVRINHWSHKKHSNCDPWWENETEWHRSWKNKYPDDWQEIAFQDEQTGERHIADVRTEHDLVIELQHSPIERQQRISREEFYENMVWLVDGTQLKRDYPRFLKGQENLHKTNRQGYFFVDFPDEVFPSAWIESSVPVIFDFLGLESIQDNDLRNYLYCLLPGRQNRKAILIIITRELFINGTINGELFKKQLEHQKQPAKKNSKA